MEGKQALEKKILEGETKKYFYLRGSFPEEPKEEIIITYMTNGQTKTGKILCSGYFLQPTPK